jgi:hypothetical protein
MEWNESMVKLTKLAKLISDERLEKTGVFGILHFFSDGYVYGSNGFFEFEFYYGGNFNASVPASRFYDIAKLLDPSMGYKVDVSGNCFVIYGPNEQVEINMLQVEALSNRIVPLLNSLPANEKQVNVNLTKDLLKVLRKLGSVASSGDAAAECRVICFNEKGIFATDRVRIAYCPIPSLVGEGDTLLSVFGVDALVDVMEDELLFNAYVVDRKLYVKVGDDFYVGVLGYDVNFPDLFAILSQHKQSLAVFSVDPVVMEDVAKLVKILDRDDVLNLVVKNRWMYVKTVSIKGFQWEKKLQKVDIDGEFSIGVLSRDLQDVLDSSIVEVGISTDVLYCRSNDGVEYIVSAIS